MLRGVLAAALAVLPAGAALAQAAPAPDQSQQQQPASKPAAKPSSTEVQGITVTSDPNAFRSSPDKRSYDLTKDLQATTGSVADALRNVPSVDVDLNGNVSIRGDGNVRILVDGQPSSQFKGPGAGQALLSIPASQFERVEVMTNPSAAYSPEGSGGVINLITRKTRKAGTSGSIRAAQGTRGRWSVGANAAYKGDRLTATVATGYRYDPQRSVDDDRRVTLDPLSGDATGRSNQTQTRQGALHIFYLNTGVDYRLDPKTQVSAEGHYNDFFYGVGAETALDGFDANGNPDLVFDRNGTVRNERRSGGASATLRRSFAGDDHNLVVVLSHDRTTYGQTERYTDISTLPPAPDAFDRLLTSYTESVDDLKGDYTRPMPGKAQLKAGFDLQNDDYSSANDGFLAASSPDSPFDPSQTDRFHARRRVDSVYATYEQPIGKVTVLAGLRGETSHLDLSDVPAAFASQSTAFRPYPSLHVSWDIDDSQQVLVSYSQRVERAVLDELDPFVHIESPVSGYAGNPNLKDQQTQVYEAGYQYKAGGAYYLATFYYKDNAHTPTQVSVLEPDGLLVTTAASLGHSTAAGLELVANGHITKALSYNVSADWHRTEFDAASLGFGSRAGDTLSGRGSLNWQATPTDLFQISVRASGRQVTPQGFHELGPLVNVGYRHKLSDQLSLFVTAQDAFATYRQETFTDGLRFRDDVHDRGRTQAAFIGFTYAFGAGAKKDEGFNYNN
jgi:outer membrane receptor protein involved in Fe transport